MKHGGIYYILVFPFSCFDKVELFYHKTKMFFYAKNNQPKKGHKNST